MSALDLLMSINRIQISMQDLAYEYKEVFRIAGGLGGSLMMTFEFLSKRVNDDNRIEAGTLSHLAGTLDGVQRLLDALAARRAWRPCGLPLGKAGILLGPLLGYFGSKRIVRDLLDLAADLDCDLRFVELQMTANAAMSLSSVAEASVGILAGVSNEEARRFWSQWFRAAPVVPFVRLAEALATELDCPPDAARYITCRVCGDSDTVWTDAITYDSVTLEAFAAHVGPMTPREWMRACLAGFGRAVFQPAHVDAVTCMRVHGHSLVTSSRDCTLKIYLLSDDGTPVYRHTLIGHFKPVTCFDAFDNIILSGSEDCSLIVWSNDGGKASRRFSLSEPPVCLEIIDGTRAARACRGYMTPIAVFDTVTGDTLFELRGHVGGTLSLDYCAESGTLASGGADRAARLWDVAARGPGGGGRTQAGGGALARTEPPAFRGPVTYVKHFPGASAAAGAPASSAAAGAFAATTPTAFRLRSWKDDTSDVSPPVDMHVYDAYSTVTASGAYLCVMHSETSTPETCTPVSLTCVPLDARTGRASLARAPRGQRYADDATPRYAARGCRVVRAVPNARPLRVACAGSKHGLRVYVGFDDGSVRWYDVDQGSENLETARSHVRAALPDGPLCESGSLDARGTYVSRMLDPIMAASADGTVVADRGTPALFAVLEDRVTKVVFEQPVSAVHHDAAHGWMVALDSVGALLPHVRLIPDISTPDVFETVAVGGRVRQITSASLPVLHVEDADGSCLLAVQDQAGTPVAAPLLRLPGRPLDVRFAFEDRYIIVPSATRGVLDCYECGPLRPAAERLSIAKCVTVDYAAMGLDAVTHVETVAGGFVTAHGARTLVRWTAESLSAAGAPRVLHVFEDLVGSVSGDKLSAAGHGFPLRVGLMNGSVASLSCNEAGGALEQSPKPRQQPRARGEKLDGGPLELPPVVIQHAPGAVVLARCLGSSDSGFSFGADGLLAKLPCSV